MPQQTFVVFAVDSVSEVDGECGPVAGAQRPGEHPAEERRPADGVQGAPDIPLHLRDQAYGHHHPGRGHQGNRPLRQGRRHR